MPSDAQPRASKALKAAPHRPFRPLNEGAPFIRKTNIRHLFATRIFDKYLPRE
jgi:hypothetical protein